MTQKDPLHSPTDPTQPPINPPGAPQQQPPAPAPAPRKRRWLRRTLYVMGGLLILLLILLLLVPTIASMGFVRSIVVGKVNDNLNGKVQIADWSIGWTGGIKVDGIKVFDNQNRQILEVPHVSTQLSLVNALKGKYDIGDTVIQGLDFNAIRYPDGTLNFAKLAKPGAKSSDKTEPAPKTSPAPNTSSAPKESKLPEVHGQLRLVDCRGTIENISRDPATNQERHDQVKISSLKGDIKIPDLNQSITNSIQVVEQVNNGPAGTLDLSGQALIAKNNVQLPIDQMDVSQKVGLTNIDLASLAFALPPTITTLQGMTNGGIDLSLKPGQPATVQGEIKSQKFKLGGPILSGDTYVANAAVITIPKTTVDMSSGFGGDFNLYRIRIGDGSTQGITIALTNPSAGGKTSQSSVKLIVDTTAGALNNLAANKAPGTNGLIKAEIDVDLVPLAQMVPHVMHMWEGSKLDSGRLAETLEVRLDPKQANLAQMLNVSPITGENPDHKKISIDPISLSLKAIDRGGLAGKLPDLHDITLNLTTNKDPQAGWATVNLSAATLSSLKGTIHADLQRAQAEVGQLMDTGDLKLGGTLDVALDSKGDLIEEVKPGQTIQAAISANVKGRNLIVDGLKDKPPIKEPALDVTLTANLERGSNGFVQAIRDLNTKILAGNEAKPSINATVSGNLALAPQTAGAAQQQAVQYAIYVDLPEMQKEFGAFLSQLSDAHLQFTGGMLGVSGAATYDGKKATAQPQINLTNIVLEKDNTRRVLDKYNLELKAPLTYDADDKATTITVSNLLIGDNTGMLRLENANNQPINLVMGKDGRLQPNLGLHIISIDLKQLNDLLQSMSAQAVATTEEGATLKGGVLTGTANVTSGNHQINVVGDLSLAGLTVAAPQSQGLQNEQIKLTLNVKAADDFSTANVDSLDASSSFLNAHVGDTSVVLKQPAPAAGAPAPSPLDMLRKASAKVEVPSLAKLQSLMDAFSAPPAAGAPKPTKLAGGNLTLTLNAGRDGNKLNIVPNLSIKNLVLRKPDAASKTGSTDITATDITLAANVKSIENNQIQLTGNGGITGLTIPADGAEGLKNEQVKLVMDIRAPEDFSAANIASLDAIGSFLNAHVGDTQLVLKQGTGADAQSATPLDMLRKATAKVDVPSLAKLQLVMDAFSPPPAGVMAVQPQPVVQPSQRRGRQPARAVPQPQPKPAEEATKPPTKLTGGSATIILSATRQGDKLTILPNLAARNVVMKQGDKEEPVGNVDVTATELSLLLNPPPKTPAPSAKKPATTQPQEPSIMDQVKELKIVQLTARLTGVELAVNGSIVDLASTRTFQGMGADLTYDAPKLWQLLVPILFDKESQAKWKDAKVAGSYKKHINIAGSYPTTLPAGQQPITLVAASGGITLDQFEAQGATLAKLDVPFNLQGGVFSTTYAGRPAGQNLPSPAQLNGGSVDLGGCAVDMTGPHMLLNIPTGKMLFHNVSLNPTFAQLFGDWINNPMFVTANQAAGIMDITINRCQNLPLDDTVTKQVPSNQGVLDATIKMTRVQLGNDTLQKLSDSLASSRMFGNQTLAVKSLQGEIPNLHVTIDHGVTRQDMTMTFGEGKRPLHLAGDVTMATRNMNMTLDLPFELFGIKNDKNLTALGIDRISLPLTGNVAAPQFDLGKALMQNAPQNILQGLLNPRKNNNAQPASQPAEEDPFAALRDALNKNKKEKDKN